MWKKEPDFLPILGKSVPCHQKIGFLSFNYYSYYDEL